MASVVRHRFRVEEDFYTQAHPGPEDVLLLVEVSLSTEAWDREKKLPLYARAGLPEVWRLTREGLEVHRDPEGAASLWPEAKRSPPSSCPRRSSPSSPPMSLAKRIVPCLDVHAGRVVKGVNFVNLRDAGDPVEAARAYDEAGADELVFLDISATHEERAILLDVVARVAERVFIPLTVGGGCAPWRTRGSSSFRGPTR